MFQAKLKNHISMSKLSAPLSKLLQSTALTLNQVQAGKSATVALSQIPLELRPGVQSLTFQVLRSLGRARALREKLARRAPNKAADALLCTVLALIWDETKLGYDAFTLVNQAVEAAKNSAETRQQASFINACLRRYLRERESLIEQTSGQEEALWNHPGWWIAKIKRQYPNNWQSVLAANNRQAPLTLRINVRKITPSAYLEQLKKLDIGASLVGGAGIQLQRPQSVYSLPGFVEGWFSVQDAAAQLAAPLLLNGMQSKSALRVLDACAAPGGKTAHLLEISHCDLTALDIDPIRCTRIVDTLARLGLTATVKVGDAARPQDWSDGKLFDAILLDAPCTGSGIVRRHPDVRWLRRESDVPQLAEIQSQLLDVLWDKLAPGGRLLYSTCSVFLEEGDMQTKAFLARQKNAILMEAPGHLLPSTAECGATLDENMAHDHDGFYYALFAKHQG